MLLDKKLMKTEVNIASEGNPIVVRDFEFPAKALR